MKFKVIVLTLSAVLALSGLALAEDMAAKAAAPAQVAEQAQSAPVAVGNGQCPVCGVMIPAADAGKYTVEHKGKIYNVCSPSDKDMFLSEADRYGTMFETGHDPKADPLPLPAAPTDPAAAVPAAPDVPTVPTDAPVAPAAEQK